MVFKLRSLTTTSIIFSSSEIQNGDILISAYQLFWKITIKPVSSLSGRESVILTVSH